MSLAEIKAEQQAQKALIVKVAADIDDILAKLATAQDPAEIQSLLADAKSLTAQLSAVDAKHEAVPEPGPEPEPEGRRRS